MPETDVNTGGEASSPQAYEGVSYDAFPTHSETNDNSPHLGNEGEEAANALNAGGEDTGSTDDGQEPQSFAPVPYDRFKQKNEEWKTATARAQELEQQLRERDEQLSGYKEFDAFFQPVRQQYQTGAEFQRFLDEQAQKSNEAQLAQLALEDVDKEIDAGRVDGDDDEAVADRRKERLEVRRAEQFLHQQQEQTRLQQERQQAEQIQNSLKTQLSVWKKDYPGLDEESVTNALYAKGDWNAAFAEAKRTHNRNLVIQSQQSGTPNAPQNAQGIPAPTPMGAGNSAGVTPPNTWNAERMRRDPEGFKKYAAEQDRLAEQRSFRGIKNDW